MIMASLHGLPAFLLYLGTSIGLCALFLLIYTWITPNREFQLIFRDNNSTAAIAVGSSLLGFVLPLASAIHNSAHIVDCVIWGIIALLTQLVAYFLAYIAHPDLGGAIRDDVKAAGIWVGSVSIAVGILSAASMTY